MRDRFNRGNDETAKPISVGLILSIAAMMLMTAGCEEQLPEGSVSVQGEDSKSQRRSYPADVRTITGYELWVELERYGSGELFGDKYGGTWIRIESMFDKEEGGIVYLGGWYAGYVELRDIPEEEISNMRAELKLYEAFDRTPPSEVQAVCKIDGYWLGSIVLEECQDFRLK